MSSYEEKRHFARDLIFIYLEATLVHLPPHYTPEFIRKFDLQLFSSYLSHPILMTNIKFGILTIFRYTNEILFLPWCAMAVHWGNCAFSQPIRATEAIFSTNLKGLWHFLSRHLLSGPFPTAAFLYPWILVVIVRTNAHCLLKMPLCAVAIIQHDMNN